MVFFGAGRCLGWQYPVLLLDLAVQPFTVMICFISIIKEPAQPFQPEFWALLMPRLHFVLTFASPNTHPA